MIHDVCIDTNGGGAWRYDDAAQRYFRTEKDGTISGMIFGKFLPDPNALWKRRLRTYKISVDHEMAQNLKPQPATFELWRHWNNILKDMGKFPEVEDEDANVYA